MSDSNKCWRCGATPFEFKSIKPARPVCSVCMLQLLDAAIGTDIMGTIDRNLKAKRERSGGVKRLVKE